MKITSGLIREALVRFGIFRDKVLCPQAVSLSRIDPVLDLHRSEASRGLKRQHSAVEFPSSESGCWSVLQGRVASGHVRKTSDLMDWALNTAGHEASNVVIKDRAAAITIRTPGHPLNSGDHRAI